MESSKRQRFSGGLGSVFEGAAHLAVALMISSAGSLLAQSPTAGLPPFGSSNGDSEISQGSISMTDPQIGGAFADSASRELSLVGAITNLTSQGKLEGIVILKDSSGKVIHQDVKKDLIWQGERYEFISIAPNQVKLSRRIRSGNGKELVLTFQGSESGSGSGLVSLDQGSSWSSGDGDGSEVDRNVQASASNWDGSSSPGTADYDPGSISDFDRPQTYAPIDNNWPVYHDEDAAVARDEEYQDLWHDGDPENVQPYRDVDVAPKNELSGRPTESRLPAGLPLPADVAMEDEQDLYQDDLANFAEEEDVDAVVEIIGGTDEEDEF